MLTQMIMGFRVTQLLHVAAKLGIADKLADGPKSRASSPSSARATLMLFTVRCVRSRTWAC
jgi:hypothetical protein